MRDRSKYRMNKRRLVVDVREYGTGSDNLKGICFNIIGHAQEETSDEMIRAGNHRNV